MKTLLSFALCLCAIVSHAANPSTKSFRATGGLVVTSNDVTGVITYDGSGISSPTGGVSAATATNIVTGLVSSGAKSTNVGVGETLYLDASFGNNATAQRTNLARPFLSASNAVAAMIAGDTLVVRGGDYPVHPLADAYDGSLLISNKNDIAIRGEPDSVFQLSSLRGDEFGTWGSMLQLRNCTNVLIDGMTFRGLRTNGNESIVEQHYAIMLDNCERVTIRNCVISNWQNQGITCMSPFTTGKDYTVTGCKFYNIGGTNAAALGFDGAGISLHATNLVVDGNYFFNGLWDVEICCSAQARGFKFVNNVSEGNYHQVLMLQSAGIQDVVIANNYIYGYSTALPFGVTEARFIATWGMSNAVIRDNYVFGMNAFAWSPNQGVDLVDVQILDNTFQDSALDMIYTLKWVGQSTFNKRMVIRGNKFRNTYYTAVKYSGADGLIENNTFDDCHTQPDLTGVITIGSKNALDNTNTSNLILRNNRISSTAASSGTTGIVLFANNTSNSVYGNEISRLLGGSIKDYGTGTLTAPVNILASGAMLYSDTNSRLARVTTAGTVSFNPTTGVLTGTGGGSGGTAITSINEFTNSEVVLSILTNALSATVQVPFLNAFAGGFDWHLPWAGPATSGPLSSNDWARFNSAGGTNTLIRTNGVTMGSVGTVNWTAGVTGSVSGAVATLGVSASGGGITAINENTETDQDFTLVTNAYSATVQRPYLANVLTGLDWHFPWAGPATAGPLASNDWQRFNASVENAITNNQAPSKTFTNSGVYMPVAGPANGGTNFDWAVRDVFTNTLDIGTTEVSILFSNVTANRQVILAVINRTNDVAISFPATVIWVPKAPSICSSNSTTLYGFHTYDGKTNGYVILSTPEYAAGALMMATNVNSLTQLNIGASNQVLQVSPGLLPQWTHAPSIATNAASFTITTNNFVMNAYNTNLIQRSWVAASISMTNDAATDRAMVALYIDQDGDGTWERTGLNVRCQGVIALSSSGELSAFLQPGARFIFTNLCTGAAVAAIEANSSQFVKQ